MQRPWLVAAGGTVSVAAVVFAALLHWRASLYPIFAGAAAILAVYGCLWVGAGLTDHVGRLGWHQLLGLANVLLGTALLAWAAAFVAVASGIGSPQGLGVLAALAGVLALVVGVDWLRGGERFGLPGAADRTSESP